MSGVAAMPGKAGGWLGPLRWPRRWTEPWLEGFRALADWLGCHWRWCIVGLVLGVAPVALEWWTGLNISRTVTALCGVPLLLAAVSRDRIHPALTCLCLAIVGHSFTFIALAARDPDGMARMFPPGIEYWEETRRWIETGESKVYDVGAWVPFHLQLAAVMVLWCYLSLGFVPLAQGLYELDLMNVYVGRLLGSAEPGPGLLLAWHPWSICRGIGFLFLTYELTSLSFARLTGERLSTPGRRWLRWLLGLGFLCLDGVIKYLCLEPVRRVLAEHLGVQS
jgi:hypothetical protein